jgi:hypothetical protein
LLDVTHEVAVEAFMAAARMSDPEKHALVCSTYPVKSRRQMRRISEIEIPVGLHPELYGGGVIAGATEATYAELALGETA